MVDLSLAVDSLDKEDGLVVWPTTRNPLLAMEALVREDGAGKDSNLYDTDVKNAFAHRLKKNASSKDLLFTIKQLASMMQALVDNRHRILEFAICADNHRPSCANPCLAPQLEEALPVKLCKKTVKYKESMADTLADVYFLWRGVACCPQVMKSLPHECTHFGKALYSFTLALVCMHTFCIAELEEEHNTTKALKSEKISGEEYSCVMICICHCHLTRPLFLSLM